MSYNPNTQSFSGPSMATIGAIIGGVVGALILGCLIVSCVRNDNEERRKSQGMIPRDCENPPSYQMHQRDQHIPIQHHHVDTNGGAHASGGGGDVGISCGTTGGDGGGGGGCC